MESSMKNVRYPAARQSPNSPCTHTYTFGGTIPRSICLLHLFDSISLSATPFTTIYSKCLKIPSYKKLPNMKPIEKQQKTKEEILINVLNTVTRKRNCRSFFQLICVFIENFTISFLGHLALLEVFTHVSLQTFCSCQMP